MKYRYLLLLFIPLVSCDRGWTPPVNPDPSLILDEAQSDYDKSRYDEALRKHIWFHENALKYKTSLYGVRLSFALGYWHRLGEAYPPAMVELKRMRDETREKILAGERVRDLFHDFSSINRVLSEDSLTANLFRELDHKNPEVAKEVFTVASTSLVLVKDYDLYAKYIDSDSQARSMIEMFQRNLILAKDSTFSNDHRETITQHFSNQATTMISILSLSNRQAEARKVAEEFIEVYPDSTFMALIDSALLGKVPEPWP